MESDKITLDRKAFRALSSDTRVKILKSLDRRRKMLTELSKELGMSPSTVKEHMQSLSKAGLVVMIDDGHKWKYYELTGKGESVLHPTDTRIWILLSVSLLAVIATAADLIRIRLGPAQLTETLSGEPKLMRAVDGAAGTLAESAPAAASTVPPDFPYIHAGLILVFGVLATVSAYAALRKR